MTLPRNIFRQSKRRARRHAADVAPIIQSILGAGISTIQGITDELKRSGGRQCAIPTWRRCLPTQRRSSAPISATPAFSRSCISCRSAAASTRQTRGSRLVFIRRSPRPRTGRLIACIARALRYMLPGATMKWTRSMRYSVATRGPAASRRTGLRSRARPIHGRAKSHCAAVADRKPVRAAARSIGELIAAPPSRGWPSSNRTRGCYLLTDRYPLGERLSDPVASLRPRWLGSPRCFIELIARGPAPCERP
jgi:hypothetical protein